MRFKEVYQHLTEGGNAVEAVPIEQKNIPATLKDLQKQILTPLKLNKRGEDWEVLGSAGKKSAPSGDLDIAVNLLSLLKNPGLKDQNDVIKYVESFTKKKGLQVTVSHGIGVVSFSFPINGQDGEVQVDLMITDDMGFTTWAYFSPSDTESRFKKMGFYRGMLLSTVISTVGTKVTKKFDDSDDAQELEQMFLDFSKGFGKKLTSFVGKSGKKVKTGKVLNREFISKVPQEIVEIIFGKGSSLATTNSFESIMTALNAPGFPFKKAIPEIKKKVKDTLVRMGLPVPEELN
jgi:hypothetical protein